MPAMDRRTAWCLLAIGAALTTLTGPRWGIAALAWLAPVPYLLFARGVRGWRPWLALVGVLVAAHTIQFVLIATPPVPLIATLLFGPPLALLRFGAIAGGEIIRRRAGEAAGALAYVAATVVLDWVGYGKSELGAWMATASSQVESLTFLQLASIAGLAGLGAIMATVAATIASAVAAPNPTRRLGPVLAVAGGLVALMLWATFRLDQPLPGRSVAVAAVVTDLGPDEHGMPDDDAVAASTEALFARTQVAAARGARLVVWNEVATLVDPAGEAAFVARARAMARDLAIDLVLAYAVLESRDPVLLDNKYLFIADDGRVLDSYQKHHPVPGEPSIRGSGPLRVLDRPYGRVGGAICYDYDFPALAREHARAGADLVVLPSSDWRGIDPVHTFMARLRAIEGGFALVRSVRWAPSGAFDAHGRIRAWMTAVDDNDGVMLADLPVGRTPTLATRLGDAPVAAAAIALAGLVVLALRRRRRRRTVAALLRM
ncbi:MAG TPA: nitrilase-related carbon-nitrogen hydrolase [Kofleriaceae bacterium]|nr:nitrilase-related carbon-nitrogen hydrolase [Kofleriaceae bacterium]